VIFSIFGKKSAPPKKAKLTPTAAGAPDPKSQSSTASALAGQRAESPQAESGDESLDFSTYIPPPLSEGRTEEPSEVPQLAPAASVVTAQPRRSEAMRDTTGKSPAAASAAPRDSVTSLTAVEDVPPIIEEAAILFANGRAEHALSTLSQSVREKDLGAAALQAWLMLFDLYQHLGRREEFETLALEFVVKFERSPPAWLEIEERRDPALATGGIGYLALTGMLTGASAPELDKLRSTPSRTARIDCGRLLGLDGPGCRLLSEALLSVRDAGKEVILTGESRLLALLERLCQAGKIETDAAAWTLLLDVYRMLDLKDKFEETAVNYAVTFEVSPPSWEAQPPPDSKRPVATLSPKTVDQALVLSGELTGANDALAQQLRGWAAANRMPVIDMSRTTRVDPATAGLILDVLAKLHEAGTMVQIRGVNELIRVLFRVTGMHKVARVIPRK
jgi:anti-anti-sigma regulatory factor